MRHGRDGDGRMGGLMWGIGLVLVGTMVLLQSMDVLPFSMWSDWWPAVVILVGFGQVVVARSPKRVGEGVSWMLLGGWFFVATNHVYGLTWRTSWPLALVATGFGMVARSIAGAFMRRRDDVQEVRIDA